MWKPTEILESKYTVESLGKAPVHLSHSLMVELKPQSGFEPVSQDLFVEVAVELHCPVISGGVPVLDTGGLMR